LSWRYIDMTVFARFFNTEFRWWKRRNRKKFYMYSCAYKYSMHVQSGCPYTTRYFGILKPTYTKQRHQMLSVESGLRVIALWDTPFVLSIIDHFVAYWGDYFKMSKDTISKHKERLLNFITKWPYRKEGYKI
jgi:hypothetical protein